MSSFRCTICTTEWPPTKGFATCPECGEPTWLNIYGEPESGASESAPDRRSTPTAKEVRDEGTLGTFAAWLDTVTADDFRATLP